MAIITDAIIPMANSSYMLTGSKKLMIMFDGPMPTKEQFKAVMNSTLKYSSINGQYNILSMINWAATLGATAKAHCLFPATVVGHHMGPTKMRFPLSEQNIEFTKLSTGPVTWFMYATVHPSTSVWNQSYLAYFVSFGDIGDVDSGADIQLSGATITENDSLKANDLIFNYAGF